MVNRMSSKKIFIEYLKERLIPDLRESGKEATAEDFEEAIHWMTTPPNKKIKMKCLYETQCEECGKVVRNCEIVQLQWKDICPECYDKQEKGAR